MDSLKDVAWGLPKNHYDLYKVPLEDLGIPIDYSPVEGSLLHIYGPYSSGKSILAVKIADKVSKDGYTTIHFPTTKAMDLHRIFLIDNYYIVNAISVNVVFDVMRALMNRKDKFLFILDDISSMRLNDEVDMDSSSFSKYLTGLSNLFRTIRQPLSASKSICIMISQMRTQISKSRQVSQFRYVNDMSDVTYEILPIYVGAKKFISMKAISKITGHKTDTINLRI